MSTGAELIAAERRRQIEIEGYTPEHDAEHRTQLRKAAIAYLLPNRADEWWPWDWSYWKPSGTDQIRNLVKAGALIAAEIDRLDGDPNQ